MSIDREGLISSAVILAGGFGTRVQHLLPGIPKPMAPVCGKPFLEWVVRYLARQGVPEVVLSTGYLSKVIHEHFASIHVAGTKTICVSEPAPLGTAGGFLHAARESELRPASWLVLNGDSLCFTDLAELAVFMVQPEVDGVVVGYRVDDSSRYGTLTVGEDGGLLGFKEKQRGDGIINAGVYVFRHSLLGEFPSKRPLGFETDVFPALVARGTRFKVGFTRGPFLDIGTPESLSEAERFVLENRNQFSD